MLRPGLYNSQIRNLLTQSPPSLYPSWRGPKKRKRDEEIGKLFGNLEKSNLEVKFCDFETAAFLNIYICLRNLFRLCRENHFPTL